MTAPELRRYCLVVQYDGAPFHGWQIQAQGPTVQGEIERVLERLTEARRPLTGAGRTDRGVHALGQVASVRVPERWSAAALRTAMNALLPSEIRVSEARRVPDDFHPRFDAVARSYEYRLGIGPEADSPFRNRWCWDLSEAPPDLELLESAAHELVGERSFRKFAKVGQPERGERCRVNEAQWSSWNGVGLRLSITANRYLHHMVRYLVGTMVAVAQDKRPLDEFTELLNHPSTTLVTSPPAPSRGLFLARVEYPPDRLGTDPDRDPPQMDEMP